MKTIYLDVLIFTNLFEDFIFLLVTKYILRQNIRYYRLLLGSLFGGISSLFVLLPEYNFVFNLIFKLTITAIMVLITFGYTNKKIFLKTYLTLFLLSFLVTGGLIFFYLALRPKGVEIINDTVYFNISPTLLIILTLTIYFILLLYRKLISNHSKASQIHKVRICMDTREVEVDCKCDSGCNLKEPFSNSYVIIVEKILLKNILNEDMKFRVIPFDSLGGSGIIYGFCPEKVYVDNKQLKEQIYIGICENILKTDVKGLIPENLIRG
ncbi:MAG: sigma-E processing peptidase SpoIIGA [Ruminococcus sp.]